MLSNLTLHLFCMLVRPYVIIFKSDKFFNHVVHPVSCITRKLKAVYSTLYPQIYSGARDGAVVSSKLDLRVYHPCKVKYCNTLS